MGIAHRWQTPSGPIVVPTDWGQTRTSGLKEGKASYAPSEDIVVRLGLTRASRDSILFFTRILQMGPELR